MLSRSLQGPTRGLINQFVTLRFFWRVTTQGCCRRLRTWMVKPVMVSCWISLDFLRSAQKHWCRLVDTLVRHSWETFLWVLWDTPVRHSCGTLSWDTLARNSCKTPLWDPCKIRLLDTPTRHSWEARSCWPLFLNQVSQVLHLPQSTIFQSWSVIPHEMTVHNLKNA